MRRPELNMRNTQGLPASRATKKLGRPDRPAPSPSRRAIQLPNGNWVDGKRPGHTTHRAPRACPFPDPLHDDPATTTALLSFRSRASTRPAPRQVAQPSRDHHWYRDQLALQVNGAIEVSLDRHRADVLSETRVFEVEPRRTWRSGVGQAVTYSAQCGLPPVLAVFGEIHRDELLRLYLQLRGERFSALIPAAHVELWWWAGTQFERINARSRCMNMPHGSSFGRCEYCGEPVVRQNEASQGRVCHDYILGARQGTHHCNHLCAASHNGDWQCPYWLADQASSQPRRRRHGGRAGGA